jgi:flagellar basal body rod protein FlgF
MEEPLMSRSLAIALTGAVLLGGAACGDSLAPADVAGTWNATSAVFTSVADPSTNSGNVIAQGASLSITLGENGSASLTIDDGSGPDTQSGTFSIDGSNLTLTLDGDVSTGTIELNGDTLTVRITNGPQFDFDNDGTDEDATVVVILTRA